MMITPEITGSPALTLTNTVIDPNTGNAQEYRQLPTQKSATSGYTKQQMSSAD
jgi:hypothetical protein